jgi:hypothetical protein
LAFQSTSKQFVCHCPLEKKVDKSNFNFDQKKKQAEVFLLIGFLSADVTTSIIDK